MAEHAPDLGQEQTKCLRFPRGKEPASPLATVFAIRGVGTLPQTPGYLSVPCMGATIALARRVNRLVTGGPLCCLVTSPEH